MNDLTVHTYSTKDRLPSSLMEDNFFHSRKLFELSMMTPRHKPYLITMENDEGLVIAQLLALVRYRASLLPPYFYMQCRVLGEGTYRRADGSSCALYGHDSNRTDEETEYHAQLFSEMIEALKKIMDRRVLFIEVSNLSQKMFGYRSLKRNGFFPIKWMSIHNSLHSRPAEKRINNRLKRHIDYSISRGVTTVEVHSNEDFNAFIKLLRRHHWLKPRRYIPANEFFKGIMEDAHGKLSITRYQKNVIGCTAIVYSQGQAYLWYSAYRRKTFAYLHPADITIWNAIKKAQEDKCEHIYFMDVGLPFQKNRYREFILSFGGKPVSTYRWFHCRIGWINKLLGNIYS